MADVLWKLEPATAAKHRLYRRYLDAWWPKLLQPTAEGYSRPRVTYIDAFAGPGRYLGGEEGSPVFVLDRLLHHQAADRMQLTRDRVKLIFVEKDKARFEHLQGELTSRFGHLEVLPVTVVLRRGEAAELTLPLLDETGAWEHPILAVFDSWGNVNVPLNPVIARIARNRSSEAIVTFGPNWFNRRESEDPDQFDAVFGGRQFWQTAGQGDRPIDRWQTWLNAYRSALRRAGFTFQLQFKVVPGTGQPLYLVFGSKHRSGVGAMKDAMWSVDGASGMRFEDPRVRGAQILGQIDLFEEPEVLEEELVELVHQRLVEKPLTTIGELGNWLLLETSRWRSKDAKPAIQQLRDAGQIVVQPSGRITRMSTIRLLGA